MLFLMWCDDGRLLNCTIHKFETSVGCHFFSSVFHCGMFLQVINSLQLSQATYYYADGGVSEFQPVLICLVKETTTSFNL